MTNIEWPFDLISGSTVYPALGGTAIGGIPGVSKVRLQGSNLAISNSLETLWAQGSGTYAALTAAVAMEVVSGSANDAAAGTGARTVVVQYLNSSWDVVNETVTLNGIAPVALASTAIAVNNVYVATAGSGLVNAGNVDVRTVSGSTLKLRISTVLGASLNKSQDFVYTIPNGYIGVLKSVHFSGITVTGDLTVVLESISSTGLRFGEGIGRTSLNNTGFNGAVGGVIDFGVGLYLPSKTAINAQAVNTAGAGAVTASADLFLLKKGLCPWVPA